MLVLSLEKTLLANDTGHTGGHQADVHVIKLRLN